MATELIDVEVTDRGMAKQDETTKKPRSPRRKTGRRKSTAKTPASSSKTGEVAANSTNAASDEFTAKESKDDGTSAAVLERPRARTPRKRATSKRSQASKTSGAKSQTRSVAEASLTEVEPRIEIVGSSTGQAETDRSVASDLDDASDAGPTPARESRETQSSTTPLVGAPTLESTQRRRSRRGRRRKRTDGAPLARDVATRPLDVSPTGLSEQVQDTASPKETPGPVGEGPSNRQDRSSTTAVSSLTSTREPRRRRRGRRGRGGATRADGVALDRTGLEARSEGSGTAATGGTQSAPISDSPALRLVPSVESTEAEIDTEPDDPVVALDFDVDGQVELDELGAGDEPDIEESPVESTGTRQMMINVSAGTECRIAILHENRLEEFFIERESTQSHVGNIYKGRITNVESSIQAAFIDFGLEKNGFLHISDVQPQYFPNHTGEPEDVGRKIPRHHRPPIQKCFRRGQEVMVQITKEGVGTKGPTLTSYLSIPGRFLVMMPGMSRHGVSRKIEDDAQRRQMRELLGELSLPSDMGFILRTAGLDRTKRELQRDLNYLMRLWKTVVDRIKRMPAPAELYRESDLVTRTIRDVYTADFDRIVVDDAGVAKKVREFLQIAMPRTKTSVEAYADREPIFHRFGIEAELERINMRHVPLPSGGSLVIDSTEAMVAIDVNSGRFRSPTDAEETALRINIEAAEEIARQLRLRDLGGLIVCDFIDLRHDRNKRRVEQALRDALKKHKERARILRMSAFGLIEMTRQRQGPSLRRNLYADCPFCRGSGQVKQPESVMLDAMRMIQLGAHNEQVQKIVLNMSSDVAFRLLNQKRVAISQIEAETGKTIIIHGEAGFTSDQMEVMCEDGRGRPVAIAAPPAPPSALLPTRSDTRGNGAKPR